MSTATSYMCFGCTDVANNERTAAYTAWACSIGAFDGDAPQLRWMCICDEDAPENPYVSPAADNVCWYDPLIPESEEFLGIIITDVRGIRNSTFSRETENGIVRGTLLEQPFIAGKTLVFEAIILATSCAGMDYGIEWLRRQFEDERRCPQNGTTCASCQGQLLTLRVHCPTNPETVDRGLHSFPIAGTTDGIDLVEDDFPMGRRNCCTMRRITWTMQTQDGSSYSTEPLSACEVTVSDGYSFQRLGNCSTADPEFPCCPICAGTCDPCTTDPGCDCFPPFVLTPEVVGGTAPCFTDPLCRCIRAIGLDNVPSGYDAALRFRFFAGWNPADPAFQKFGLRNTVVRIFENPSGMPLPTDSDMYDDLISTTLPCAEFGISWMPAGSELIVDGLTGQSWLLCNGKCVDHSSRVFSIKGNVFPLVVRCVPLIVTTEWDCLSVQDDDISPAIPSSVTMESYTRHRL